MARAGSPRKPGRAPLRGWRLAALAGVAAVLAVAGCSSGGGDRGGVGVDHLVGQPDQHQRYGRAAGADQQF
jgi:hypothetical protein